MKLISLCFAVLLLNTSCYKTRTCNCTYNYTVSGKTEEVKSQLTGKMTKSKGKKECNKLDGTYIMGSNLEEVKIDCTLSE